MTKLNCKPGDLAVIVDAPNSDALGLYVSVVRLEGGTSHSRRHYGSPLWITESARGGRIPCGLNSEPFERAVVPDSAPRPIRDPGDDVQDETLAWLPVPSTTKEVA